MLWRAGYESPTAKAQSGMLPVRLKKAPGVGQSGRFAGASEEAVDGEMVRSGVGLLRPKDGQK